MNRRTAMMTTACVGLAATTAAYMLSDNKSARKRSRAIKKTTGKAIRQVGDFIDNISYMMK